MAIDGPEATDDAQLAAVTLGIGAGGADFLLRQGVAQGAMPQTLDSVLQRPRQLQRAGLVSRPALRRLMDWAGGQPFTLEIT